MAKAKRPDTSPSRKSQRERTEKNKRNRIARNLRQMERSQQRNAERLGISVTEYKQARQEHKREWERSWPERHAAYVQRRQASANASLAEAKRQGLISYPTLDSETSTTVTRGVRRKKVKSK